MIRVHMLTWPLTETNRPIGEGEAKKLIDIQPNAQRSNSFQALKAYFANIAAVFSHPKHRELDNEPLVKTNDDFNTETANVSTPQPAIVTIEEEPVHEDDTTVVVEVIPEVKDVEVVEKIEEPVPEVKQEVVEEEEKPEPKLKKSISRMKVLGMVTSMQTSSESSQRRNSTQRRRLGSIQQWESKSSRDGDTMETAGGDGEKIEEVVKKQQDQSSAPSTTDASLSDGVNKTDNLDNNDSSAATSMIGNHGDKREERKKVDVKPYEEDDDEAKRALEENVDTLSVQDMVKGFMYIKQNPNVSKMPKSFKKRTTVTLIKPQ